MKKQVVPLVFLIIALIFSGCKSTSIKVYPEAELSLINPMGPLVLPLSGFLSGEVQSQPAVRVHYWKTIDEAVGYLSKDETAFVVLPVTVAANLKASGIDLVMLGAHEWKVFYLIASPDKTFDDICSLKGETIYTPEAKGQTVDTLTRYALGLCGLDPDKDVDFVFLPPQEIVALFKEGKVPFAALPEPFVSLALVDGAGEVVLDYQDYWSEQTGTVDGIPIAGLFVSLPFYEARPDLAAGMADLMDRSIKWMEQHPREAIQYCSEVISMPEKILQEALPRMKFEFIRASDCKQSVIDFLTEMRAVFPEGIKVIPTDDFFAIE